MQGSPAEADDSRALTPYEQQERHGSGAMVAVINDGAVVTAIEWQGRRGEMVTRSGRGSWKGWE